MGFHTQLLAMAHRRPKRQSSSRQINLSVILIGNNNLILYTSAEHTLNADSSGDLGTAIQPEGCPTQQSSSKCYRLLYFQFNMPMHYKLIAI